MVHVLQRIMVPINVFSMHSVMTALTLSPLMSHTQKNQIVSSKIQFRGTHYSGLLNRYIPDETTQKCVKFELLTRENINIKFSLGASRSRDM